MSTAIAQAARLLRAGIEQADGAESKKGVVALAKALGGDPQTADEVPYDVAAMYLLALLAEHVGRG